MISPESHATGFRRFAIGVRARSPYGTQAESPVPQSRDELTVQVHRAAQEALRESDLLLLVVDAKKACHLSTKSSREHCANRKNPSCL